MIPRRRFYRFWGIDPAEEVEERELKGLGEYTLAVFDESGQAVRVELHRDNQPVHIEYRASTLGRARNEHMRRPRGVPFCVVLPNTLDAGPSHFWGEVAYFFRSAKGNPENHKVTLFARDGTRRMTLSLDERDTVLDIEKRLYGPDGEIRFIFHYGTDGEVVEIYDAADACGSRLEDALAVADDPEFYRRGHALPTEMKAHTFPSQAELRRLTDRTERADR